MVADIVVAHIKKRIDELKKIKEKETELVACVKAIEAHMASNA